MGIATPKIKIRALLIVGALIVTYASQALYQEKFGAWNSRIIDHLFSARSRIKPMLASADDRVIHVDANFNAFRSQHAQVIRNLSAMDISILALDTIFSEQVGDEEDLPLINAAAQAGNVYLGLDFDFSNQPAHASKNELNVKQKQYLDSTKWQVTVEGNAGRFPVAHNPVMTYAALTSASHGLGFLNIVPDPDGILRRIPLLVKFEDGFYPSIAFQVVCHYLNVSPQNIIIQPGSSIILKGVRQLQKDSARDLIIPIDASGNMILNYTGSWKKIRHYSYSEILRAHETAERLQTLKKELSAKIVVMSERVEAPIKIVPISDSNNLSSGVIHSIVIQNILQGSFLRELSRSEMILIEIALLIVVFYLSVRFSALTQSLGTIVLGSLFIIIGAYSFFYLNVIFQFIRPLLMVLCALLFILIASAVERSMYLAETERAKKLAERELDIGREIQTGFFPNTLPNPDGWELVSYFQAARHVGGDFYDAFSIGNKKDIGFVVADVCDKGVGAALFMALFRSLIRVLSGSTSSDNRYGTSFLHNDPTKALQHTMHSVNNYISTTHDADNMFSTIFFGILDPESGVLHYINGGHEPPMIINGRGIKTSLYPTGPAVGLFPNAAFDVSNIQLEPEDVLLAYTDGVIDARDQAGGYFTRNRLAELVTESYPSAKALVDRISFQLNDHSSGQEQFDDITILALRRERIVSNQG